MKNHWENKVVSLGELTFFTQTCGAGTPLLMIHGAICDSDFFLEAGSFLAHQFSVILYDRRGYSRSSSHPDYVCSIESQAADAAGILQHFTTEPAYIVACSAGTEIALQLAMSYPHLVRGVILHEAPMISLLPPDPTITQMIDTITDLIGRKRFNKALFSFADSLGTPDPRGNPVSEEVAQREYDNSRYFLIHEYAMFLSWHKELCISVPAVVGVGESSESDHYCVQASLELQKVLNVPLAFFPGKHNAAREMPMEFSGMVYGLIGLLFNNNF